jgi:hypothetical protein
VESSERALVDPFDPPEDVEPPFRCGVARNAGGRRVHDPPDVAGVDDEQELPVLVDLEVVGG